MQTEIKALRLLFEPGSAGKGEHAAFEELNRFIAVSPSRRAGFILSAAEKPNTAY